jgi:hypothetical protein
MHLICLMKIIKNEHSIDWPNCRICAHILKRQNLFTIVIASCQICRFPSQPVSFPHSSSQSLTDSQCISLPGDPRSLPVIRSVAVGAEPQSRPSGHRHLEKEKGPRGTWVRPENDQQPEGARWSKSGRRPESGKWTGSRRRRKSRAEIKQASGRRRESTGRAAGSKDWAEATGNNLMDRGQEHLEFWIDQW